MSSHRIRLVASFEELIATPFAGDVNALCWPRALDGDFQEIVDRLATEPGITTLDEDELRALALSPAGNAAREVLLTDQDMLRRAGLDPCLDCVAAHPRKTGGGPVAIDVGSFHVDSATVPADTYLCTYAGACTEGLANEMAIRHIDDPETRTRLLGHYGGADDDDFAAWLGENFYDLHYRARDGAEPYAFGLGNLWRIAIRHPGCPVLPCVHRAPSSGPGTARRLLLIA